MDDEPVGIEALWRRIAAAQCGWDFFLKWMLVVGAARSLGVGLQFAASQLPRAQP